jgi:hypothetical protein
VASARESAARAQRSGRLRTVAPAGAAGPRVEVAGDGLPLLLDRVLPKARRDPGDEEDEEQDEERREEEGEAAGAAAAPPALRSGLRRLGGSLQGSASSRTSRGPGGAAGRRPIGYFALRRAGAVRPPFSSRAGACGSRLAGAAVLRTAGAGYLRKGRRSAEP